MVWTKGGWLPFLSEKKSGPTTYDERPRHGISYADTVKLR